MKTDIIPKDVLSIDLSGTTRHKWVEGKWIKDDALHLKRTDICSLCGCERSMIRFFHFKQLFTDVVSYARSKQSYGPGYIPPCWGATNP